MIEKIKEKITQQFTDNELTILKQLLEQCQVKGSDAMLIGEMLLKVTDMQPTNGVQNPNAKIE